MVVGDWTLVGIRPSEHPLSLSQNFFFFWVVPKRFSLLQTLSLSDSLSLSLSLSLPLALSTSEF